MSDSRDLDVLRLLADRSLEGHAMTVSVLEASGIELESVLDLDFEGLVEIADDEGEPTVALTDAWLSVLRPHGSA